MTILFISLSIFTTPARADITIGLAAPFTGENAFLGEQMKRGVEQAVADINMAGGVVGQELVLRLSDDACDPKQAVTVANQMAGAGIKFVVGHGCSGASIPASKVYNEEGMFMITPSSSNPALTDPGYKTIFRTYGRDDAQGAFIAQYILDHYRSNRLALVNDRSAWGRGLTDEIKKRLNAAGMKEVSFESYAPSERDFSSLITKLKQAGTQVAFIGGYFTEVGLIARQLREQSAHIQIIGGDALVTMQFWSITGSSGNGVLMSTSADPRKRADAKLVLDEYRKADYEPEAFTFFTYAAVQTIAEGIKRAGKADPALAADALRQAPVKTIVGNLSFDAKGDVINPAFAMYRWHDGKYAEVEE